MATTSPGVLLFDAAAIRATLASYDGWWSGGLLIVELRRLATSEDLQAIADGMLRAFERSPSTERRLSARRDCCRSRAAHSTRSTSTLPYSSTAPATRQPC